MCLKLSLLSLLHHLHSTCTNSPFSLVMQADFILNSCLWVCPSSILELQHTFLPSKWYKLGSMPLFYFIFRCFILGPTFWFFKKFGGTSINIYNLHSIYQIICHILSFHVINIMKKPKYSLKKFFVIINSFFLFIISFFINSQ